MKMFGIRCFSKFNYFWNSSSLPTRTMCMALISSSSTSISQETMKTLVCPSHLGIQNFQKINSYIRRNILDFESYEKKMFDSICPDSEEIIHAEDVKKMIAISEKDFKNLNLTLGVLTKYYNDCKLLKYEPEKLGPIFARLLYVLEQHEMALKVMKSEELGGYFTQYSTYLVTLSLLYKFKRFEEIITLMDAAVKKKQFTYPKNCLVVACAAAYIVNSDEALQRILSWLQAIEVGERKANLRSIIFMAATALNRNRPDLAKQLISKVEEANSIIINNIFLLSSCVLGEYDDVLDSFRISLHMNKLGRSQPILTRDVLERIETLILKTEVTELINDFHKLNQLLEKCRFISNQTYEQLLFEPITGSIKNDSFRLSNRKLQELIDEEVNSQGP